MDYEKRLEKINELHENIRKNKIEILSLMGMADGPKRGRPPKEEKVEEKIVP